MPDIERRRGTLLAGPGRPCQDARTLRLPAREDSVRAADEFWCEVAWDWTRDGNASSVRVLRPWLRRDPAVGVATVETTTCRRRRPPGRC